MSLTKNLDCYRDERGTLFPLDFESIPFTPRRVFFVTNVPKGCERGNHAHFVTNQYLLCVKGSVTVHLFDCGGNQVTTLNEMEGIFVPKLCWDSQIFNTGDDILCVFASTPYDEADYITDMKKFKTIIKK